MGRKIKSKWSEVTVNTICIGVNVIGIPIYKTFYINQNRVTSKIHY